MAAKVRKAGWGSGERMCTALKVHASTWVEAALSSLVWVGRENLNVDSLAKDCKGITMGQGSVNATFAYD